MLQILKLQPLVVSIQEKDIDFETLYLSTSYFNISQTCAESLSLKKHWIVWIFHWEEKDILILRVQDERRQIPSVKYT